MTKGIEEAAAWLEDFQRILSAADEELRDEDFPRMSLGRETADHSNCHSEHIRCAQCKLREESCFSSLPLSNCHSEQSEESCFSPLPICGKE